MFDALIRAAVRGRLLVVLAAATVVGFGAHAYSRMPVDAFPDVSPILVPVFAEAHGMAPEEVERLIAFPVEAAMNGLPDVTQVKSTSAFGMAVVYVYFEDDVDIHFARQLVAERLAGAMGDLPEMHDPPALGPISTGLGQVFKNRPIRLSLRPAPYTLAVSKKSTPFSRAVSIMEMAVSSCISPKSPPNCQQPRPTSPMR